MFMSTHHTSEPAASQIASATLYIVATPIGNLADITHRAVTVLSQVDTIACEDTRVSQKLLTRYGIHTRLRTYHEHNAATMRDTILQWLHEGASVALISDAGTPLISDPGYKLVDAARAAGFAVVPIPGANAAITALCASGLPTDCFAFGGFLPSKAKALRDSLMRFDAFDGSLVFYESPKRIVATLEAIIACFGTQREVVVARELTKQHEEFLRGTPGQVHEQLARRERVRGEIVLLLGPPSRAPLSGEAIDALLREALESGSTKQAAKRVAAQTGQPASELYQRALELKS